MFGECPHGKTALQCSECPDSMTPSEDGPCVDCEPMDPVVVVMLGLLVMLSLLGIHFLNDKRNRGTMTVSILRFATIYGCTSSG